MNLIFSFSLSTFLSCFFQLYGKKILEGPNPLTQPHGLLLIISNPLDEVSYKMLLVRVCDTLQGQRWPTLARHYLDYHQLEVLESLSFIEIQWFFLQNFTNFSEINHSLITTKQRYLQKQLLSDVINALASVCCVYCCQNQTGWRTTKTGTATYSALVETTFPCGKQ